MLPIGSKFSEYADVFSSLLHKYHDKKKTHRRLRKEAQEHNEKLEEQRAIIKLLKKENKRLSDEITKDILNGGS